MFSFLKRKEPDTRMDQAFLEKVNEVVTEHYDDPEFSTEDFADEMCMSRMNLHRKLKSQTGHSATAAIRAARLEKAAELIENDAGSITEICYEVGFNHPSYFARRFKETYGVTPSEFETETQYDEEIQYEEPEEELTAYEDPDEGYYTE